MYSIQMYMSVFYGHYSVFYGHYSVFHGHYSVFSTNKANHPGLPKKLLKVALNTNNTKLSYSKRHWIFCKRSF